jgi:hypothetical protein
MIGDAFSTFFILGDKSLIIFIATCSNQLLVDSQNLLSIDHISFQKSGDILEKAF